MVKVRGENLLKLFQTEGKMPYTSKPQFISFQCYFCVYVLQKASFCLNSRPFQWYEEEEKKGNKYSKENFHIFVPFHPLLTQQQTRQSQEISCYGQHTSTHIHTCASVIIIEPNGERLLWIWWKKKFRLFVRYFGKSRRKDTLRRSEDPSMEFLTYIWLMRES